MRPMGGVVLIALAAAAVLAAGPSAAQPLTADRAVQIALQKNSQIVNAEANVLDARGNLYRAYAGVLPTVSAGVARGGSRTDNATGITFFRDPDTGIPGIKTTTYDDEAYSTSPQVAGRWNVFNLSSFYGLRAGGASLRSAKHQRTATRQDVAQLVRTQFYAVVRAVQLARVATEALKLAHDDERRVGALFEVGSVSKSDVLKARVRSAQSTLDSLTAVQAVTNQRIALAQILGVTEREMGVLDTVLVVEPRVLDEGALLAEAERNRPDLRAAEAEMRAARATRMAARLARLPYVTLSGSAEFNTKSSSLLRGRSETDRQYAGEVALNLDLFDLSQDATRASARAREIRAREGLETLRRTLTDEVHQALLNYAEAVERRRVSESAVESATENLKLTQQKYNVGSSTILELIDAQVQLQRAHSDHVSAAAAIRVAEATIERVRGRGAE